jgi:integrase
MNLTKTTAIREPNATFAERSATIAQNDVPRGKGAKPPYVPLPPSTLQVLRQQWTTRRQPRPYFPASRRRSCHL